MKWSKEHFNWPGSGLMNLECTNVQDTWVAESNKGVHTLRMWHKEMGRWQGQRRSFKPQTLAGKMPSRRWVSGRVPGKSLVWIETSPLGLFTSEREKWIHFSPFWVYSHLLLLKGKSSPLILASKRETWAAHPPLQWLMAASRGACDSLAAQDDGKHSAHYSTPVLLPTESTPQALPQVQALFNPQSACKSKNSFSFLWLF